jgi:hypothetical protein
VVVIFPARTWRMIDPSTAWLTLMPAASLAQDNTPPQVAHEFPQLLRQGHGLIKVCEEFAEGASIHVKHLTIDPFRS